MPISPDCIIYIIIFENYVYVCACHVYEMSIEARKCQLFGVRVPGVSELPYVSAGKTGRVDLHLSTAHSLVFLCVLRWSYLVGGSSWLEFTV